jgi:glycosyltransferase involved in cell wall biosynthesis
MKYPLVSVICPTTPSRRKFWPRLERYYEWQTYPHKELVMESGPGTIGAKRNLACAKSLGQIILHMDDDDYYAPDWISHSVDFLLSHPDAKITGISSIYFEKGGEIWLYTYGYPQRPWVGGATLCYYKSVWERHCFLNKMIGEDIDFIWKSGATVMPHDYIHGFMATIHGGNTYQNDLTLPEWSRINKSPK